MTARQMDMNYAHKYKQTSRKGLLRGSNERGFAWHGLYLPLVCCNKSLGITRSDSFLAILFWWGVINQSGMMIPDQTLLTWRQQRAIGRDHFEAVNWELWERRMMIRASWRRRRRSSWAHSGVFKIHQEPDWLTKRLSKDGLFGHSTVDEQIKVLIFSVKHSVKIVYSLPNAAI